MYQPYFNFKERTNSHKHTHTHPWLVSICLHLSPSPPSSPCSAAEGEPSTLHLRGFLAGSILSLASGKQGQNRRKEGRGGGISSPPSLSCGAVLWQKLCPHNYNNMIPSSPCASTQGGGHDPLTLWAPHHLLPFPLTIPKPQ